MKRIFISTTLCFTALFSAHNSTDLSPRQEGMHAIKLLATTLKTELIAKMHLDQNATAAMTFCTSQAQALTEEVNAKLPGHVKVRRTSLQLRNKANTPDEIDTKVMLAYQKAVEEKKSTATMMQAVKVGTVTRVYKPLLVGKACLKCHGETLSPTLIKALQETYPEDNATGLHLGEFRGVIVSEVSEK